MLENTNSRQALGFVRFSTGGCICFTCKFQQLQHDLSRTVPVSTVPGVSFSLLASSSLLLQILQQVLLLNRCSLPGSDTMKQDLSFMSDYDTIIWSITTQPEYCTDNAMPTCGIP